MRQVLFISHRWEHPAEPDGEGEQLKAAQEHLRSHVDIEFVWFDFSCLPQRKSSEVDGRTADELEQFGWMLGAIADLYLTARVLILMDNIYLTRFW